MTHSQRTTSLHRTSLHPSLARIFVLETRNELLKILRMPAYILPTLGFPAIFYLIFGVAMNSGNTIGSVTVSTYMLATYGAFGVIGAALFSLGAGIAMERGQGWMLLKRATPMPPVIHLMARTAVAVLLGLLVVMLLMTLAAFSGVRLPTATWVVLAAVLAAGAVPFSLAGMAIGYLAGPNSAPVIVNMIYLPVAFASGLWVPIQVLPSFFKQLAPWLPTYHYAQLALTTIDAAQITRLLPSMAALTASSLAFLALALWGYRRDQGVTYG